MPDNIQNAKINQFTGKGLANMFTTPKESNEWRPVNANVNTSIGQTSVSVNRNVPIVDSKIKPRVVVDQTQGKVVDVRQLHKNVKKK